MKKLFVLSAIALSILSSCDRDRRYSCKCENPGGTEVIFREYSSEKSAWSKCDRYYQDNYGNIPMNETHCWVE